MNDTDNGKIVAINYLSKELDETKIEMSKRFDDVKFDMTKGFDEIKEQINNMNINNNSAMEIRNKEVDNRIAAVEKLQNSIENKMYYLLGGIAAIYAVFNIFKEPLAKLIGV